MGPETSPRPGQGCPVAQAGPPRQVRGAGPGQWPLWGVLCPCPELPRPLSPAVLDLRPRGAGPSAGQPGRLTDSRRSGGGPPASPARSRRSEPGSQPGSRPCSHLAETWSFGPGGLGSWHGGRTPGTPSRVGSLRGSRHLPDPRPLSTCLVLPCQSSSWAQRAPGWSGHREASEETCP